MILRIMHVWCVVCVIASQGFEAIATCTVLQRVLCMSATSRQISLVTALGGMETRFQQCGGKCPRNWAILSAAVGLL